MLNKNINCLIIRTTSILQGEYMIKIKLMLASFLLLAACATNPDGSKLDTSNETTLEAYNRAMFNFNYQLDKKVIYPVAKGYKKVTNQFVRDRVTSLFNNLDEPSYFINDLLQGEIKDSGISLGRFLINSTLGLFGTFDVASGWGLERKKNSFDETLAKYCVPDGPFIMMPVLGPSTPRSLVGLGGEAYTSPLFWTIIDTDDAWVDIGVAGATALKYINLRAENEFLLQSLEDGSVDYYMTIKSSWLQNRQKYESLCTKASDEGASPSYDFDFGYDEFDEEFE